MSKNNIKILNLLIEEEIKAQKKQKKSKAQLKKEKEKELEALNRLKKAFGVDMAPNQKAGPIDDKEKVIKKKYGIEKHKRKIEKETE